MSKTVSSVLDQDHRNALEVYQEDGRAESFSEAQRLTSRAELARQGYLNGTSRDTMLRRTIREASKIAIYPAIFALGIALFYPFAFRAPALVLIIAGLVLQGVDAILAKVEPTVSNHMKQIVGVEA